jgi:exopolyphosphatase/guanosine-5'-triphosphate,3'-diphosphate pyrophosphatase
VQKSVIALAGQLLAVGITETEIGFVESQLGRYPRGVLAVGARCVCGNPLVVITRPSIAEGTKSIPFPTTFYLTALEVVKPVSRLEGEGLMAKFNQELHDDPAFADRYCRAHEMYLDFRHEVARITGDVESLIASKSAGGMPERVKCLHALTAQSLVMGAGVNPVGDRCLEMLRDQGIFDRDICRCAHPGMGGVVL